MSEESKSVLALEVADRMLAEVASVDDARQLINLAEMARVYARQSRLGTSAINHATVIKIRAEQRLADIVDQGQERGEIADQHVGRPRGSAPAPLPPTFDDLGIQKERLAEARLLRDSYTPERLAERQREADEQDEILSRQRLIADARAENERNGAIQRQRTAVLFPVYEALAALAAVELPASEWAAQVLDSSAYRVSDNLEAAYAWLADLRRAWTCR